MGSLEPASHPKALSDGVSGSAAVVFSPTHPISPNICKVNTFPPEGQGEEGASDPSPTSWHQLTMSGSQRDSHIPYICSAQVPLTTKSSVTMGQPMRSREQMKGLKVFGSNPAMTGSV